MTRVKAVRQLATCKKNKVDVGGWRRGVLVLMESRQSRANQNKRANTLTESLVRTKSSTLTWSTAASLVFPSPFLGRAMTGDTVAMNVKVREKSGM